MNAIGLEQFWNNKHPRVPIIYNGRAIPNRSGNIKIDVRKMFWSEDYMLEDVIRANDIVGSNNDETAWLCQKYIVKNYQYVFDEDNVKYNEYWQMPNETLFLKAGDCEDCGLLMGSLMTSAGIPIWRIRVNAGWVLDKDGGKTGHAYVTYCRETDNNWTICDWCHNEDSKICIAEKPLAKNIQEYKEIWFSFNSQYSWAYKQYDYFDSINNEPKTLFLVL